MTTSRRRRCVAIIGESDEWGCISMLIANVKSPV